MELINQHAKGIMEGCKERAAEAGLRFESETLEYIVTNRDLLELSPKNMIPGLYDYWVHDVEVLREKGRYELYPNNPYETVINTRPVISFYNDNNPDWLNVMIFYHVLAHIDFFQNNSFFKRTWEDDFEGQALADKRTIARLRSEKGRYVDYAIEFARGIDNLVSMFRELSNNGVTPVKKGRVDYYFDVFLQKAENSGLVYQKEVDRYNTVRREFSDAANSMFFVEVSAKHPEFQVLYEKWKKETEGKAKPKDLIQFLMEESPFLQKEETQWMKTVMEIVRRTSVYFQPQRRTKILNEGWASYWHERLFLADPRIRGNEVNYARVNAKVTAMPKVGLNPYALGMRLFSHLEEVAGKGKITYEFEKIKDACQRKNYDAKNGSGQEFIFRIRQELNDFLFLNSFVDQDFVDRHKFFVVGKRMNSMKGVWEYFVKSRRAEDYKEMLLSGLYHPPEIRFEKDKPKEGCLFLDHVLEGRPLVNEFIQNTMLGISYLWGGPVMLETSEMKSSDYSDNPDIEAEIHWQRVRYRYDFRTKDFTKTLL